MSFVVRQAGQGAAYDFGGARFVMKASTEHSFTVTSRSEARVLVVVGPPRFDAHVAQRGIPSP
jgi:hypothetical protein